MTISKERWQELKWPAVKLAFLILLLGLLVALAKILPLQEIAKHPEKFKQAINDLGSLGMLIYIGVFIMGLTMNLPGILFIALGGALYGTLLGGALALVGAMGGVSLSFGLSRLLGRDFVSMTLPERLKKYEPELEKRGLLTMIILRIFFLLNPWLNWALGLTSIKFRDYFLGSLIGLAPLIFFWCHMVDILPAWLAVTLLFSFAILMVLISRIYLRQKEKNQAFE